MTTRTITTVRNRVPQRLQDTAPSKGARPSGVLLCCAEVWMVCALKNPALSQRPSAESRGGLGWCNSWVAWGVIPEAHRCVPYIKRNKNVILHHLHETCEDGLASCICSIMDLRWFRIRIAFFDILRLVFHASMQTRVQCGSRGKKRL